MPRTLLVALLALIAGCARRLPSGVEARSELVEAGGTRVRVVYWSADAASARQVVAAIRPAVERATRWGALQAPITVTIHPTHASLEAAVHRPGLAWLRAWARFDTIDLQAPATWKLFGARDEQVAELLTHELTHCAMYQRAATEWSWSYKGIPLWFREGMASVTAGQGYRRVSTEALWRYYQDEAPGAGDGDPLSDPELLVQDRSEVIYGAAHHAFHFLLARYGEVRVRGVLEAMRAGAPFERAFQEAIGLAEPEFLADFRRYLVWQGWH